MKLFSVNKTAEPSLVPDDISSGFCDLGEEELPPPPFTNKGQGQGHNAPTLVISDSPKPQPDTETSELKRMLTEKNYELTIQILKNSYEHKFAKLKYELAMTKKNLELAKQEHELEVLMLKQNSQLGKKEKMEDRRLVELCHDMERLDLRPNDRAVRAVGAASAKKTTLVANKSKAFPSPTAKSNRSSFGESVRSVDEAGAAKQFRKMASKHAIIASAAPVALVTTDPENPQEGMDTTSVKTEDIELVMSQAGCSKTSAARELRKYGGDLIQSLMSVSEMYKA